MIVISKPKSNLFHAAQEYEHISFLRTKAEEDFLSTEKLEALRETLENMPGCSVHGRLPSEAWSPEHMHKILRTPDYVAKIKPERQEAKDDVSKYVVLAGIAWRMAEKQASNGHQTILAGR